MDPMDPNLFVQAFTGLGTSLAANVIYDFLRRTLQGKHEVDRASFDLELGSFLALNGVNVSAATAIEAFARHGLLEIRGSSLYAPRSVLMGAGTNAVFEFGFDSESRTANTAIQAKGNAHIRGRNAAIRQNPDGSIDFLVGKNEGDNISFHV